MKLEHSGGGEAPAGVACDLGPGTWPLCLSVLIAGRARWSMPPPERVLGPSRMLWGSSRPHVLLLRGQPVLSDPFFLDVTGHLFVPRQQTLLDQELMSVVLAHNKASRSWLNSMRQVVNLAFHPCQSFLITEAEKQDRAARCILQGV